MKYLPLAIAALLVVATVGTGVVAAGLTDDRHVGTDSPRDALSVTHTELGGAETDSTRTAIPTDQYLVEPADDASRTRTLAIDPENVTRSAVAREHADLGPAIAGDVDSTSTRLALETIERRLASAETAGERQRRVLGELNTIEQQIVTLEERQETVIQRYGNDELTSHEFVVELVSIHRDAAALQHRLDVLTAGAADAGYTIDTNRRQAIESNLQQFSGPVRQYAAAVIRGEEEPDRLFLETGDNGVVLTALDEDTYVREVLRMDRRDSSGGSIDLEAAEAIVEREYPEIWNRSSTVRVDGSNSVVRVRISYDESDELDGAGSEMVAFVDGATEEVFKEHRTEQVDSIVATTDTARVQSGLNVTVRQTSAGGPVEVTVVEQTTGVPIEGAIVTVGQGAEESVVVGETDADGTLHALEPRGSYTVSVIRGTNTAFVELESLEPRPLAGSR
ncbi:MAG: DUF7096 domain-containing protein [Halobacteriota archaeon]